MPLMKMPRARASHFRAALYRAFSLFFLDIVIVIILFVSIVTHTSTCSRERVCMRDFSPIR